MVLYIGSTLLRTVRNVSARHSPAPWNCLFKVPGLSFHSFTRNLNRNIFSDFNIKCNKPGQRLGITKCVRFHSTKKPDSGWMDRLRYSTAVIIVMTGATVLSVPLYRVFCQKSGRGGKAIQLGSEKVENMKPQDRVITVKFNADLSAQMQWRFRPQQKEIQVRVGETALAFYTAKNPTDKPIIGISTYTIVPFQAGYYFNKIQCFCFEEQRLNPGEEVEMPVFFYLDPDLLDDPRMANVDDIVLSYTFFSSKDQEIKYPGQQVIPSTGS
ncbi:cytochrome c oxidase assembly protein ctaG-like [Ostrea edulis]|uniref:cytochrome c oxidase assembly protein ctaG-like n=1 Tax=Ostrea edulis TaxID=37623 RepID=UPI002094A051|nr:cytochrome c oxidase assembly protein ctaG-like [Ostrea edulis]